MGSQEHEILNTLQEITMAMVAYKTKGLDPRTQAIACINGFQGQLKYWWDNFLLEEEHTKILDFQKTWTDEDGVQNQLVLPCLFIQLLYIFQEILEKNKQPPNQFSST